MIGFVFFWILSLFELVSFCFPFSRNLCHLLISHKKLPILSSFFSMFLHPFYSDPRSPFHGGSFMVSLSLSSCSSIFSYISPLKSELLKKSVLILNLNFVSIILSMGKAVLSARSSLCFRGRRARLNRWDTARCLRSSCVWSISFHLIRVQL